MLFRWWDKNNITDLVGLDFLSDSIKLLKIKTITSPFTVEAYVDGKLPPDAIVKGEIKNIPVVASTLKEIFYSSNIKTKYVAFAIPRSAVITKNITIDRRLSPSEIESRAWIEANHHFPDLVGEIYLDFNVIGPSPQDTTQLDLLLVACRKDQITPYLDAVNAAGLTAKIVDVNSYALERALSQITGQYSELNTVALLDLNINLSSLIVVHEKNMIYAHDHNYEGQRLMAQVNEFINKSEQKSASLADSAYVDILKSCLTSHLRHTMHFFYSSRPNIHIQKLLLAGSCATIPSLADFIKQEVGVETVLVNPFEHMTISKRIDSVMLQQQAPTLMLCCGLALSEIKKLEVELKID